MKTTLAFLFFMVAVEGTSAQVHISSPMAGGRACYKDQFEVTCWYPEVTAPGRYLVPSPGWKVNGSLLALDGTTYCRQRINDTATKLTVTVTDTFSVNTDVAYSCFLVLADTRLDDSSQQVHIHIMATPNPPVITNITSLSTFISLNWTHDKTCFESVPLEYHLVVNTDTQPIITDEMGTVISVISGRAYTVSVMAVVDDSQRSEPGRESITADANTLSVGAIVGVAFLALADLTIVAVAVFARWWKKEDSGTLDLTTDV